MNNELIKINNYLKNTYKTDRIKIIKNNSKDFKYSLLIDNIIIDELNSINTYDINNSLYYHFTAGESLDDEREYIKIIKKELKLWKIII